MALGGQLLAGILSPAVARGVSARGALRATRTQSVHDENGTVTLGWRAAVAALCANLHSNSTSAVTLCAAFEYGNIAANGSDTSHPRSADRPWASIGPALTADWIVVSPLFVRGGIDGVFPLVHDRFLLGQHVIYRIPPFAFRAELGLGVHF